MKRFLAVTLAALALAGCASFDRNPYEKAPFYARYLDPGIPRDQRIQQLVGELRAQPASAPLHNELGTLLSDKGFPNDAEREFERAVNADGRFYAAWYNLGLVRLARGEYSGARRAFSRTLRYKPGHAAALFQMGLLEEKRHNPGRAVKLYAKAFRYNRALLDVRVNPRILDTKLVHLALLEAYPKDQARQSMHFQGTPAGYTAPPAQPEAPAPQTPPL